MPERSSDLATRAAALLGLLLAFALAPSAHARILQGEVVHVTDGDTVWLRTAPREPAIAVRLMGIDAPEICQAHGARARHALLARLLRQRVRVVSRGEDDFGRTLARIEWRGQDQGAWMVAQGHAWAQRWRGRAGRYAEHEEQARAARLGLWREARPIEPREFRRRHGSCRG